MHYGGQILNKFSTNKIVTNLLGLLSPSLHCTVHASDGFIEKLTNSKSNERSRGIRVSSCPLIYLSEKSKVKLNNALEGLNMKTIHMMSFFPTKMSYIFIGCKQAVADLVPLFDVIATANLKPEESVSK